MAETIVEVKKAKPATRVGAPHARRPLRSEMEELFDQFIGEFGFPSMRRVAGTLGR